MPVAILGSEITLWCFDLKSNSKFKVLIGELNDIDDLKEAIKEKSEPCFNKFASDELTLWSVNTNQDVSGEMLNYKLADTAQKIRDTFYDVEGDNIRVAVKAPDTGESRNL
jgi:hypothetical protein